MGARTTAANTCGFSASTGTDWFPAPNVDVIRTFRANCAGLSGAVGAQVVRRRGCCATAVDGNELARGAEDVSPVRLFARDDDETRSGGRKCAARAAGSSCRNFGPATLRC